MHIVVEFSSQKQIQFVYELSMLGFAQTVTYSTVQVEVKKLDVNLYLQVLTEAFIVNYNVNDFPSSLWGTKKKKENENLYLRNY